MCSMGLKDGCPAGLPNMGGRQAKRWSHSRERLHGENVCTFLQLHAA